MLTTSGYANRRANCKYFMLGSLAVDSDNSQADRGTWVDRDKLECGSL